MQRMLTHAAKEQSETGVLSSPPDPTPPTGDTSPATSDPPSPRGKLWDTPKATDGHKVATGKYSYPNGDKTRPFLNLGGQVEEKNWATPHANCHTGAGAGSKGEGADNLQTQATTDTRRRLNPWFVAWLMGMPPHWLHPLPLTSGGPTPSGAEETRSWRLKLDSHVSTCWMNSRGSSDTA
jgi:hypothetical protein